MLNNQQRPKSSCNDVGFAIFFVISMLCNIGFAGFGVVTYGSDLIHLNFNRGAQDINLDLGIGDAMYAVGTIGLSILISVLWIFLCTQCGEGLIKSCLIAQVVLYIVNGVFAAIINPFMIIPFLLCAVIHAIWLFFVWGTIPFCQALFSVALKAFREYWTPVLVHIFMVVIAFIVIAIDVVAMMASDKIFHFQNGDQTALFSFGFVQLVFLFWHSMVFETVAYCTSCGVMCQYLNREPVSTMSKFATSFTTIFGSICMGTLITAFVNALRVIAAQRRAEASRDGNMLSLCVYCCIECLLQCLGDFLEYINTYAYVYVAKNQQGYIQSAKDVWNMFQSTGFLPLVNDMVLGAPLMVGALLLLMMNLLIGCAAYNLGNIHPIVVFMVAFIGVLIYSVIVSVIMAYIKTTFVLWAEGSDVFSASRPEYARVLGEAATEAGGPHHVIPDADVYQMQQESGYPEDSGRNEHPREDL